jgi:neopullulanase
MNSTQALVGNVVEVFNKDPHITSFFTSRRMQSGSDGTYDTLLDTSFDYPLYFALRASLTDREPITVVADVLEADGLYTQSKRDNPLR